MKKIFGIILIIVCAFLILTFVRDIFSLLIPIDLAYLFSQEIVFHLLTCSLFIAFLFFGVLEGIKLVKGEKPEATIPFHETMDIRVQGTIAYKDYRNVILGMNMDKPLMWVAIAIILVACISAFSNPENSNASFYGIVLALFVISPLLVLLYIKHLYNTSSYFKSAVEYHITNNSIHMKGEAVEATIQWSYFYKKKETKFFFLFYQGKMLATFIDKKMFSEKELEQFHRFVRSLPIKN
jgi:hypothetical protein